MSDFAAPDGSSQPLNTTTIQTFQIPRYNAALLVGNSASAWEQAVVVIVNGVRHPTLLGTHHHAGSLLLFPTPQARDLQLVGWHKQSGPDGGEPWHASRGRRIGDTASWDDTGGDMDFDDYWVRVALAGPPPMIPRQSNRFQSHAVAAVATFLGLKEAAAYAPDSEARAVLERRSTEDLSTFVDLYSRHWSETAGLCDPLPSPEAVASELALAAYTFEEGPLRMQLLQAAGQFAASSFIRQGSAAE